MKYIVDRIISGIAVCEDAETGETVTFRTEEIPFSLKESDIFEVSDGKYSLVCGQKPVNFSVFGEE